MSCRLTLWSRSHFSGVLMPTEAPFMCVSCGCDWVVFWCSLNLVTKCVGSGGSWEGLLCRPKSVTTCIGLEPLSRSYKVIYGWLLIVLCTEVLGRGYTVNQGQLPLLWAWCPLVGITMQAEASCHLCLACRLVGSCYRPGLAAAHAMFGAACWELKCNLSLVTTCARFGSIWQELQCT